MSDKNTNSDRPSGQLPGQLPGQPDRRQDSELSADPWLENLLDEASWPANQPEQLQRLERHWVQVRRRGSVRRWFLSGLMMAASLLVAVMVFRWVETPPATVDNDGAANSEDRRPDPNVGRSESDDVTPPTGEQDKTAAQPNAYQMAMHYLHRRRHGADIPPADAGDDVESNTDDVESNTDGAESNTDDVDAGADDVPKDPLGQFVAQLPELPPAERQQQWRELKVAGHEFEGWLWSNGGRLSEPQRGMAISWLATVRGRAALPSLMRWTQLPATREAAVVAVAPMLRPEQLGQLLRRQVHPVAQRAILSQLLREGSRPAVGVYLSYVQLSRYREVALQVLRDVDRPPAAVLMRFFQSPRRGQRLSAALALGEIDDPAVVRQLIAMTVRNVFRHEALTALVVSSNSDANQFVLAARRDLVLAATLESAMHQLRAF